jgi:hypothetical protein
VWFLNDVRHLTDPAVFVAPSGAAASPATQADPELEQE